MSYLDNITLQVTRASEDKTKIFGIDVETKNEVVISHDPSKSQADFSLTVNNPDNSSKFAPPNSIVTFYAVNKIGENQYQACYSQVNSRLLEKHTFAIAPVRVDNQIVERVNINGELKGSLAATIISGVAVEIDSDTDAQPKILQALKSNLFKNRFSQAHHGFMLRVGYIDERDEKQTVPYEFYLRADEEPEDALIRLLEEAPQVGSEENRFIRALQTASLSLNRMNGVFEVLPITRTYIDDHGNLSSLDKYLALPHFKVLHGERELQAYTKAAITFPKSADNHVLLNRIEPLPRFSTIASLSGDLGDASAINIISEPLTIEIADNKSSIASNTLEASNDIQYISNDGYPLSIAEKPDAFGKLTNFYIVGNKDNLATFNERIVNSTSEEYITRLPGLKGFRISQTQRSEVLSKLSDLLGSNAIYSEAGKFKGQDVIYIRGRINEEPFKNILSKSLETVNGTHYGNSFISFPISERIKYDAEISNHNITASAPPVSVTNAPKQTKAIDTPRTATQNKQPSKSNSQSKFPSFEVWMERKFNNFPNEILEFCRDDIRSFALDAGIDWDETAKNINVPSVDSKPVLYKSGSQKNVVPTDPKHNGAVSINVSAKSYKSKNSEQYCTSIHLAFINRAISEDGAVSGYSSLKYVWDKYEEERSNGKAPSTYGVEREQERLKREEQRQIDAAKRIHETVEKAKKATSNAVEEWNNLQPEDGNQLYLANKAIKDAINLIELRKGSLYPGNNFSAYQLWDMKGNMHGLQKLLDKKLVDQGKNVETTNKLWTTDMPFADPETGQSYALHAVLLREKLETNDPILFSEGFATGTSAALATNYPTVIAQTKGNLFYVVEAYRRLYPNRVFIILADNDLFRKHESGNVGMVSAIDAAWANNCKVAYPNFNGFELSGTESDFNDLQQLAGLGLLKVQINDAFSVPDNIIAYHNLRLRYLGSGKTYESNLIAAIDEIRSINPNLPVDEIKSNLTSSSEPEPIQTVDSSTDIAVTPEWPVSVEIKNNKNTGKPYLLVKDLSNNNEHYDRIQNVVSELLGGKPALFYPSVGGFIAPVGFSNMVMSRLHDLTGSQELYIGKKYNGNSDAFVIRGNINHPEIIKKLKQALANIPYKFDKKEMGYVVDDNLYHPTADGSLNKAMYIETVLSEHFTPKNNSQAIKLNAERQALIKDNTLQDIDRLSKAFSVERKNVAATYIRLRRIYGELISKEDYLYAAVVDKNFRLEKDLGNTTQTALNNALSKAYVQRESLIINLGYTDKNEWSNITEVSKYLQSSSQIYNLTNDFNEDQTITTKIVPAVKSETIAEQVKEVNEQTEIESNELSNEQNILPSSLEQPNVPGELLGNDPTIELSASNEVKSSSSDNFEEMVEDSSNEASEIQPVVLSALDDDNEQASDVHERLINFIDYVHTFLAEGITTESFEEEYLHVSGHAYFTEGFLNKSLLTSDLKLINQLPIPHWPQGEKATTAINVIDKMYNTISAARINKLEEWITEFTTIHKTPKRRTFANYLSGVKPHKLKYDHPYIINGEFDEEILKSDLDQQTDFYEIGPFYDAVISRLTNQDVEEEVNKIELLLDTKNERVTLENIVVKPENATIYKIEHTDHVAGNINTFYGHSKKSFSSLALNAKDHPQANEIGLHLKTLRRLGKEGDFTNQAEISDLFLSQSSSVENYKSDIAEYSIDQVQLESFKFNVINVNGELSYISDSKEFSELRKNLIQDHGTLDLVEIGVINFSKKQIVNDAQYLIVYKAPNGELIKGISNSREDVATLHENLTTGNELTLNTRIALREEINFKEIDGVSLALHKYARTSGNLYTLTSSGEEKFYTDFTFANAAYHREEKRLFPNLELDELTKKEEISQSNIKKLIAKFAQNDSSASELYNYIESTFDLNLISEKMYPVIEKALAEQVQKNQKDQAKTSLTSHFDDLITVMNDLVQSYVSADEAYEEFFKKDGLSYSENPYYSEDANKVNMLEVKSDLNAAGYKNFHEFYESIYLSMHNAQSYESSFRYGKFIPDAYKNTVGRIVGFDNLKAVLNTNSMNGPNVLPPFLKFIESEYAIELIHPILAEDLESTKVQYIADTYSTEAILLLADIHSIPDINVADTNIKLVQQITDNWNLRKQATLLGKKGLELSSSELIAELCSALNIQCKSVPIIDAKNIIKQLDVLRSDSQLRISQYSFLKHALNFENQHGRVPKYIHTDIARICDNSTDLYNELNQENLIKLNRANTLSEINQVFSTVKLLENVERTLLSAEAEKLKWELHGLEESDHIVKSKYIYLKQDDDSLFLPDDISYYHTIGSKMLAFPTPLDSAELNRMNLTPVSEDALNIHLRPVSSFIRNFGYAAFETNDLQEGNLISKLVVLNNIGNSIASTEYKVSDNNTEVTKLNFKNTQEALRYYAEIINDFNGHDEITEAMYSYFEEHQALKIDASNIVDIIVNHDNHAELDEKISTLLSDSDIDPLIDSNLLVDLIESHFIDKLTLAINLQIIELDKQLFNFARGAQDDVSVRSELLSVISTLQANENFKSIEADTDVNKSNVIDVKEPIIDIEPTNNAGIQQDSSTDNYLDDLLDAVSPPVKGIIEQADLLNVTFGDRVFIDKDKTGGVVTNVEGNLLTLITEAEFKLRQIAQAKLPNGQLIDLVDPLTNKLYVSMSAEEFIKTPLAKNAPSFFEDCDPRFDGGMLKLANLPYSKFVTYCSFLGFNDPLIENTEDMRLQLQNHLELLEAVKKKYLDNSYTYSTEENEKLISIIGHDDNQRIDWLKSNLNNSLKFLANYNLDALEIICEEYGYTRTSNLNTDLWQVNANETTLITSADYSNFISDKSLSNILNARDDSALYFKATYINRELSINELKLINKYDIKFLDPNFNLQEFNCFTIDEMLRHIETKFIQTLHGQEVAFLDETKTGLVFGTINSATKTYEDSVVFVDCENHSLEVNLDDIRTINETEISDLQEKIAKDLHGSFEQVLEEIETLINITDLSNNDFSYFIALTRINDEISEIHRLLEPNKRENYEYSFTNGELSFKETTNELSKQHSFKAVNEFEKGLTLNLTQNAKAKLEAANDDNKPDPDPNKPSRAKSSELHHDISTGDNSEPSAKQSGPSLLQSNGNGISKDEGVDFSSIRESQPSNIVELHGELPNEFGSSGRSRARSVEESISRDRIAKFKYPDDLEEKLSVSAQERFKLNVEAIKCLKNLEQENRLPTADEQNTLAYYSGWGGLSHVFAANDYMSGQQSRILKELLGDETYNEIKKTVLTSFYTAPQLMEKIWSAVEHMGFAGGKVFDPCTGIGGFINSVPDSLREKIAFSAREIDPLTAKIAQYLQGDTIVKEGSFENAVFPKDSFSLVASNIPFANIRPYDPVYNKQNDLIHDYFFNKSLALTEPGGMVAFITSSGTLDKANSAARERMYEQADLVAAIRLPEDAFSKFAGTSVVTDIVFLRKREIGQEKLNGDWVTSSPTEITLASSTFETNEHNLNNYFKANPQMILGKLESRSGQFGYKMTCKNLVNQNIYESLDDIIKSLPSNVFELRNTSPINNKAEDNKEIQELSDFDTFGSRLGADSFVIDENNNLACLVNVWDTDQEEYILKSTPYNCKQKEKTIIIDFIELRDATRKHIQTQIITTGDDVKFNNSKTDLNTKYDNFVSKHGVLHKNTVKRAFASDPDSALVLALENYNTESKKATKTDIFSVRTLNEDRLATHANSEIEAISLSMARHGRIVPEYAESLLNDKSWSQIKDKLKGQIFEEPVSGDYLPASIYLAGDIREKLDSAENAALDDSRFNENVEALNKVMPEPLTAEDIKVKPGATWIPNDIYSQFISHILDGEVKATAARDYAVNHVGADWEVDVTDYQIDRSPAASKDKFGTEQKHFADIFRALLNNRKVEVSHTNNDGKKILHTKETALANMKARVISDEFKSWVWSEPKRVERLEKIYNRRFNRYVKPSYDGSHIQYHGLAHQLHGKPFTPRDNQRNGLMRYIVDGRALLAHGVGTGKSMTLTSICVEGKALKVHNKPMLAVPNNVFSQMEAIVLGHYPNAKVLSLDPKKMTKNVRHEMTSKIATGNWDVILIAHSTLKKIQTPPEFTKSLLLDEKWELERLMDTAKNENGSAYFTNKGAQRKLKSLEDKIKSLLKTEKKDDVLYIDELGIDALIVDESDNFLNLNIPTNMSHVNGVNTATSQAAMNALFLARYVQYERGEDKGVVFATGTDIRKSMSDLYVNLKIIAPDLLERTGTASFDEFMGVFGEVVTSIEVTPEGSGYRENSRLSRFQNLPEMLNLYRLISDVVTSDMVDMDLPSSINETVVAPETEYHTAFMAYLSHRALEYRSGATSSSDNLLAIATEGRKAALDLRLVDRRAPDLPEYKVNIMLKKVVDIYGATNNNKSTQVIFCEYGKHETTNGISLYDDIVKKLIKAGISENEIADSRKIKTEAQKKDFQKKMNTGEFRIAIGGTNQFGVGNNIQEKLIAMHELDPPWNPREIEQRRGRIERQGNSNAEVDCFKYTTTNSFDLFMWETLRRKAQIISQLKIDPSSAPRILNEEMDASFAEIMAVTTGNPLIKEKMELDSEIDLLETMKHTHSRNKVRAQQGITGCETKINSIDERVVNMTVDLKKSIDNPILQVGELSYDLSTIELDKQKEVIDLVRKHVSDYLKANINSAIVPIGKLFGNNLFIKYDQRLEMFTLRMSGQEPYVLSERSLNGSMLNSIFNFQKTFEAKIDHLKNIKSHEESRLDSFKTTNLDEPFADENKLLNMKERREEVIVELAETATSSSDLNNVKDLFFTMVEEHAFKRAIEEIEEPTIH